MIQEQEYFAVFKVARKKGMGRPNCFMHAIHCASRAGVRFAAHPRVKPWASRMRPGFSRVWWDGRPPSSEQDTSPLIGRFVRLMQPGRKTGMKTPANSSKLSQWLVNYEQPMPGPSTRLSHLLHRRITGTARTATLGWRGEGFSITCAPCSHGGARCVQEPPLGNVLVHKAYIKLSDTTGRRFKSRRQTSGYSFSLINPRQQWSRPIGPP